MPARTTCNYQGSNSQLWHDTYTQSQCSADAKISGLAGYLKGAKRAPHKLLETDLLLHSLASWGCRLVPVSLEKQSPREASQWSFSEIWWLTGSRAEEKGSIRWLLGRRITGGTPSEVSQPCTERVSPRNKLRPGALQHLQTSTPNQDFSTSLARPSLLLLYSQTPQHLTALSLWSLKLLSIHKDEYQ